MDAREQTTHPFQVLLRLQLRLAPTLARIQAVTKSIERKQAAALDQQRRHHRQFGCCKLEGKGMLLGNRGVAPTSRPIKLHDQRGRTFDTHLIDAVLVTAQRQHAPIRFEAGLGHRIQDQVRIEPRIRRITFQLTRPWASAVAPPPWSGARCRSIAASHPRCGFPRPGSSDPGELAGPFR